MINESKKSRIELLNKINNGKLVVGLNSDETYLYERLALYGLTLVKVIYNDGFKK